jgi:hypothetical protein
MAPNKDAPLESLIHDVNSKCASLTGAAAHLRAIQSAEEELELLSLMSAQARSLAAALAAYEAARRGKRRG